MINSILNEMNQQWHDQEIVDVMIMAECFWRWQYEATDEYNDPVKSLEFKAVMDRVKDDKIVPTVATFAKSGPIRSEIQEIKEGLKNSNRPETTKSKIPIH